MRILLLLALLAASACSGDRETSDAARPRGAYVGGSFGVAR